ncbi:hypothetical protein [Dawidia soli]|uniref:Uncharacterized protein n=1 Tax=Dawidia soli TaxID=2782352 RepID=A0AAP2DET5_9BACT|nr:hypothetical protein [Dawidia soli]MBT1690493.1 hypothetical protein [Dawidia soli]
MQFGKWKEVVSEPAKGTPLYVLGEVLKAYKQNIIKQSHRPYEFESKVLQRNHDAEMKRLEYQLGYALHSSLATLRIPDDGWQWYLDLVQRYAARVKADMSNYREVASDVYEVIKSHRGTQPVATSDFVHNAADVENSDELWLDSFDNYAY